MRTGTDIVNRKLVVVGDGDTGKTSMLFVFSRDTCPQTYVPTILETEVVRVEPGMRPGQVSPPPTVELTVFDTAGQEDYDRLRPLAYGHTDIFVVCFSVDNYNSYMNVSEKWLPELRHFCPGVPVLLVATKTDLRFDASTLHTLKKTGRAPITCGQGQNLAHKIEARAYLECSCTDTESIFNLFKAAATVALYQQNGRDKHKQCILL